MKKISQDTYYIGVDDLSIDLFESQYRVPDGISYNSYLIRDTKTSVLDTVDARKGEEWKAELEAAGIPVLYMEIEQKMESVGQYKTRIQAFAETLA